MLEDSQAEVVLENYMAESFNVKVGVRIWCTLSHTV